jgi:hypothetical protein
MRWRVHPDVVWIGEDDEIRLYDSRHGEFETLNAPAAAIWRLADAGWTLEEMTAELAVTFRAADDAQRRRIRADMREFLDELTRRDILVADPMTSPVTESAADDATAR